MLKHVVVPFAALFALSFAAVPTALGAEARLLAAGDLPAMGGTDFKGADASKVNIGTVVTLTDASGAETVITVLGAWDSIPESKIVSYLSEVGKALLGRAPGDEVQVRDEVTEAMQALTVRSIRPYNP